MASEAKVEYRAAIVNSNGFNVDDSILRLMKAGFKVVSSTSSAVTKGNSVEHLLVVILEHPGLSQAAVDDLNKAIAAKGHHKSIKIQ